MRSLSILCRRDLIAAFVVALVLAAVPALPGRAEEPIDAGTLALLATPPLKSPEATLTTLRTSVEQAYDILSKAYDRYQSSAGFGVPEDVAEEVATADLLLRRAAATLDLSAVPAVNRDEIGLETVLLLKEILDRLPALPAEAVPGIEAVKAADAAKTPIADWTLPYADIRIVRQTEGPRAGEYLFSSGTVAGAEALYDTIKAYASRPDSTKDFFEFYTLTPGRLLPPKWYLWVEDLPAWTRAPFLGNAIWQWVGLILTLLVLFGGFWLVWRRARPARRTEAPPPLWRRLAMPILFVAISFLAIRIIGAELNITGAPFTVANLTLHGFIFLATAWIAYLLSTGIADWIVAAPRIDPAGIDASLIRLASRVVGIAAAVVVIFYGATELGVSIYGVVAGLGVGGLALGLAARPTLENLIGGLILYADRPVRVGDFCEFGSKMGTVEAIGLRSTRVRSLDRTLITVPNAEFSNMQIVNHTRRDMTLLRTTIGLRYETTGDQIRTVLERVRTLLVEHPDVVKDTARVRLRELGNRALGVEIRAYVTRPDHGGFLAVQEELLLAIKRVIDECGTGIAPPATPAPVS